jgi:hypothetical protein
MWWKNFRLPACRGPWLVKAGQGSRDQSAIYRSGCRGMPGTLLRACCARDARVIPLATNVGPGAAGIPARRPGARMSVDPDFLKAFGLVSGLKVPLNRLGCNFT